MCSSPRLFAAYRVLLRPTVPGHPPCALFRLTFALLILLASPYICMGPDPDISVRLKCHKHFALLPRACLETLPDGFVSWLQMSSYLLLALLYMRFSRCVRAPAFASRFLYRSELCSVPTFVSWRPPALPHRLQCSTIGLPGLNRRVRDGNGCFPRAYRRQISEPSWTSAH